MMSTLSLSRLVEFSVQRTYNDLIILTELLPRKSDIERKIEIASFANRTRQLFIRLLALVKWAGSASKVEKCSTIVAFLDKQAMLFVETADMLAKMSRETNVAARLPSFQLPCAVEVLTLGTYSRLPACVRDKIVPPDPITPAEKVATLNRLNQIIQQRLANSNLPCHMRNFKIEHGRVIFHIDHEFEMTLTLMGDSPTIPWKLLGIDILVEDKETGEGKDLIRPSRITLLQNSIQEHLNENSTSLADPYSRLHTYCLSMQLEVLHTQAIRLSRERLGDFIKVEEYILGKKLHLSYWRDQNSNDKNGCRLSIEIDSQDPSKPLQVFHFPELGDKETLFVNQAIKSDHLSIEKLLIHTTHERAKQNLRELRDNLCSLNIGDLELAGSPPVLQIDFLQPCMPSERLLLAIDTLTGSILAHVPQYMECAIVEELQALLKKDVSKCETFFKRLKIWLIQQRFRKTAELLPVCVHEKLPFVNYNENEILRSNLSKLFFQFSKHPSHYLMVLIDPDTPKGDDNYLYFLLTVENCSLETFEIGAPFEVELPKVYLKLNSVLELDVKCILGQRNENGVPSSSVNRFGKRKLMNNKEANKKSKMCFLISDFQHIINFCEEKLTYGSLSMELQKKSICHQIRTSDEPSANHYIDIVQFPPDCLVEPSKLRNNLISCTIRLQAKISKLWLVSLTFHNPPALNSALKENNQRKVVYLMYDFSTGSQAQIVQAVKEMIGDWRAMSKLYDVVWEFVDSGALTNNNLIEVKSYTYKKLILAYGHGKNYTVSIHWKSLEKRFQLSFGICGVTSSSSNPHVIVSSQLQHEFNQHKSIGLLVSILNATFAPLLTINSLVSLPLLGVINSRPHVPVQTFCVIPQSSTHLRLVYRNTYCVDIVFQLDGLVAIRDGAYSLFDKAKVLEDLSPIQGLKSFLGKFVDRNASVMRRLSQTEDDNPPSPTQHFDIDNYMFSGTSASPMTSSDVMGVRNVKQSMTSGPVSHPNTPASPHASVLSQAGYVSSPGSNFPLSSPPSHGYQPSSIVPSPSIGNVNMPEPSPGNIFGVNSPINTLHTHSPSFLPIASPSGSTNIHSPASNFINPSSQGALEHSVNSPFPAPMNISMASPATVGWPNSPSKPRPSPSRLGSVQSPASGMGASPSTSTPPHYHNIQGHIGMPSTRFLPQRSWAAAIPTLLTHKGFDMMCHPNAPLEATQAPHCNSVYASLSQLERFLGCVFMRKTLQRVLSTDDGLQVITNNPMPGIIQFKNDSLTFKISLNATTMQSLQMKIVPCPDKNLWINDELEILEAFFESRVACAPYKPNAFISYARLLNAPFKIFKDFIQLMRLEMFPDRNMKWNIQIGLTIPPAHVVLGVPGMSALVFYNKMSNNMLFFIIQFTRANRNPMNVEPHTVVVPFSYDIQSHTLQVASDRRDQSFATTNPVLGLINQILSQFNDYAMQSEECSIFHSIREIMMSELIP